MKDLKSKNIFSSFSYERKNLSINNIINKFGTRVIDVLTTFPLSITKENFIKIRFKVFRQFSHLRYKSN